MFVLAGYDFRQFNPFGDSAPTPPKGGTPTPGSPTPSEDAKLARSRSSSQLRKGGGSGKGSGKGGGAGGDGGGDSDGDVMTSGTESGEEGKRDEDKQDTTAVGQRLAERTTKLVVIGTNIPIVHVINQNTTTRPCHQCTECTVYLPHVLCRVSGIVLLAIIMSQLTVNEVDDSLTFDAQLVHFNTGAFAAVLPIFLFILAF